METISIDKDIKVLYVTARSSPEGIQEALGKIHELVLPVAGRRFFGISRPESGSIAYRAAAEEMQEGEAVQLQCDMLVLEAGNYISILVKDFAQDITAIARAFDTLLEQPELDPMGYCVEWYLGANDVRCMIRLMS